MKRRALLGGLALLVLGAVRCDNAGAGRVLAIATSGIVKGFVYLDRNGNRAADGADTAIRNVRLRFIASGTLDTVTVLSDSIGQFRVSTVPVGTYGFSIDTTTIGDSLQVVLLSATLVTVRPGDSTSLSAAISYPSYSVRAARLLPAGRRVFLQGVLVSPRPAFGDTTGHFADTSRAIRLTRLRAGAAGIGDSVRLLGVTSTRDGQPTLDDAAIIPLGTSSGPTPTTVTPVVARSANGGALDASLVFVSTVKIVDTATVAGTGTPLGTQDYRLLVNTAADTTRLEVLLDAHAGFFGAVLARFKPDSVMSLTGVLVPAGGGRWRLKPRVLNDIP